MVQAQLKASQGEYEQALALLRQAEQDFVRTPIPVVRPIPAIRARFWIRQGRLHDAQKWAEERDLSVDNDFSYLSEYEHITLIRLLIAQESMQKAIDLLARLQQDAEVGHRQRSLIEIHMLAALAYMGLDDESTALATLEQSLVFAEPEGFIRIFVDEGPPMARLLYEALVHGIAPDYVQQMLAAFSNTETDSTTPSKTSTANSELIEPLSEREIEVLQLISEGLTNQEIATRLFLSLHTVKVHARNIYSKLGTHNRTQAVGKARALGLLSVE